MKIALVHELLTMRGGAEKVAKVFADMFPDAPIYTLLYDEQKLGDWFPKERVRVSGLQTQWFPTPYALLPTPYRFNHHLYLKRFPAAVEAWDFSNFDLVISSSSAFVHGIITNGKPKHLSYVHSPARYLFDRTHDVLKRAEHGMFGPLRRRYLERTFHKLRIWDSEAADRPDRLIAASKEVQHRIELYWRRDSDVIYPSIDDFWLTTTPTPYPLPPLSSEALAKEDTPYFFLASTLVPYKRIDIAIEACNRLKLPLKIAGTGPDARRLKSIAGPTVEFCGYVPDAELKSLYSGAAALLFPGEEDFGLVPLESMACGTPVIAFRAGGPLETIVERKTGTFFNEPTADSLAQTLQNFRRENFDPAACRGRAEEFSRKRFEERIHNTIQSIMK
ncbi:MAG: glycosyltransferase [Candidatus Peribacteraceae bacterium]|nr:glycosyltransferase [Candidatus Peribacteraceae bacterium]MDD5742602.1 glycosyltransferase [Candidatus Peribacteraceae bacterium]